MPFKQRFGIRQSTSGGMVEKAADEALLVVCVQNDFCTTEPMEVRDGASIVAGVNERMKDFQSVVLIQDWHPANHSCFASTHGARYMSLIEMPHGAQTLWPDHCIAGSEGAQFHEDLNLHAARAIIRIGNHPHVSTHSAFYESDKQTRTGLEGLLRSWNITKLTIVGLALDFCVHMTAIDAAASGFDVGVETALTRAVDVNGSLEEAVRDMRAAGVRLV